jgi:hypothetical protein
MERNSKSSLWKDIKNQTCIISITITILNIIHYFLLHLKNMAYQLKSVSIFRWTAQMGPMEEASLCLRTPAALQTPLVLLQVSGDRDQPFLLGPSQ